MSKFKIPASIQAAYKEYFNEPINESEVLAVRHQDDFYSILFHAKVMRRKQIFAVVFNYGANGYEVTDDFVPFDSIESFKNEGLTKTIL